MLYSSLSGKGRVVGICFLVVNILKRFKSGYFKLQDHFATKEWVVVDATDQVVGRLGAKVAKLLRGKYKPNFTPHVDCGDNVIIINADKVKFTGKKMTDKVYLSYTGYPGGQREITPARLLAKPNGAEKLMKKVVKGMLPKNRLGAKLLGNLYVYEGSEHKHEAQTPKVIDINTLK